MIYLDSFTFLSDRCEYRYIRDIKRTCYDSYYPFKVLSERGFDKVEFEPITIFYGGNGSGKSTALNIIAEKLAIKRDSIYNKSNFFPDYVKMCESQVRASIPNKSRIITSDDVFDYMLTIRNLNQGIDQKREELFEEYLEAKYANFKMKSLDDYEQLKRMNTTRRKTPIFLYPR